MEELFRFVAVRAPQDADPANGISVAARTRFQAALANARTPVVAPVAPPPAALQIAARLRNIAAAFVATTEYGYMCIRTTDDIPSKSQADAFAVALDALAAGLAAGVTTVSAAQVLAVVPKKFVPFTPATARVAGWKADKARIQDSIVAIMLYPPAHQFCLNELVSTLRLMDLAEQVTNAKPTDLFDLKLSRNKTIILPINIFPVRSDLPKPLEGGSLLVVKKHVKRYELGEISSIENILAGERRKHTSKHGLTLDRTQVTESEKTTETTNDVQTSEKFDLKSETDQTLKEDLSVKAGVAVSAKYGVVQIDAKADVAYDRSKETSNKTSTEHAKDVVSRAVTKVTDRTRQQLTTRTLETFEDDEVHGFSNEGANRKNISGVYQWLNVVSEAQVFNYGERLLFDLMVPEPAAFYIDATTHKDRKDATRPPWPLMVIPAGFDASGNAVVRPVDATDLAADGTLWSMTNGGTGVADINNILNARPLTPDDLSDEPTSRTYYGHFAGRYNAAVTAPGEPFLTLPKSFSGTKADKGGVYASSDDLKIDSGWEVDKVVVQAVFNGDEGDDSIDGDEYLQVLVGNMYFVFGPNDSDRTGTRGTRTTLAANPDDFQSRRRFGSASGEMAIPEAPLGGVAGQPSVLRVDSDTHIAGPLPIAIESRQANDFAATVLVVCRRTKAAYRAWQVGVFNAVLTSYATMQSDYQDKLTAQAFDAARQPKAGINPGENRRIEQSELKKTCICLLMGTDMQYWEGLFFNFLISPRDFGAVQADNYFLPDRDAATEQGRFIRFFEQAMEWEHMTYFFYPYYWARKETWRDNSVIYEDDPTFADFLKAGSARVVVPVRPGMRKDLTYYLITGNIWGGKDLPAISDNDYLPITEEIKAQDDAPGNETPVGDPWEASVPTSLIRLRDLQDGLPIWARFTVSEGKPPVDRIVYVPGKLDAKNVFVPDYGTLINGVWSPN